MRNDNLDTINSIVRAAYPELDLIQREVFREYACKLILKHRKETNDDTVVGKGEVPIYIFPQNREVFIRDYHEALKRKKFDISKLVIDIC